MESKSLFLKVDYAPPKGDIAYTHWAFFKNGMYKGGYPWTMWPGYPEIVFDSYEAFIAHKNAVRLSKSN